MREKTLVELDDLIELRRATMPRDGQVKTSRAGDRPSREDIANVLRGKRLTAAEIAAALGTTTRAVQQVVCNVFYGRQTWLSRTKQYGQQYVYYLTFAAG